MKKWILTAELDTETGELSASAPPRDEMIAVFDDLETRGIEIFAKNMEAGTPQRSALALIMTIGMFLQRKRQQEALEEVVEKLREAGFDTTIVDENEPPKPPFPGKKETIH